MAAMKPDIDAAVGSLDDYVRGHMADAEAHDYEENLFARALAEEAPDLIWHDGLGRVLRVMKARHTLSLWLTARQVEELAQSGLKVRRFEVAATLFSGPDLEGDFDILVTKVPLDLTGVQKLDAEILSPEGKHLKMMRDIAFDPADGAVFACCEAELARNAGSVPSITRVWATDESGRRLLTEIRSA